MSTGLGNVTAKGAATTTVQTDAQAYAELVGNQRELGQTDTAQEPEDNIFTASQRGDLDTVKRLIESGEATANDRDAQNITPLHWAAINANLPICRYLLEQGAEVDVIGGELQATPLQWAARNGHLYVLHLLISYNADPTIKDSQGYDSLQLTTHSSSVMSLLYMLQQPVSVNSRDLQGHTPLMWAAYQGDAISVDILLKHSADPLLQDEKGMSALHWGVVKANKAVIKRLVEAAPSLLQMRDESGKTPRELSATLKSFAPFKKALEEGGWDETGLPLRRPVLSDRNTKLAVLLLPTFCLGAIFKTFEILPWWTALPLAGAEFFGMHHVISRVLLGAKASFSEGGITNSPYCAGIITGTMVWLGWTWFTRIVYNTPGYATANLLFIVLFILCAYNFFRAITLDAGYCPVPSNEEEKKMIIETLTSEGRLNGQTFCVSCMAQKPLRSKHCRHCDKCVARHDHHCPWVWNCVGVNNHRQFLVFVGTLVLGIAVFDYLAFAFFSLNTPASAYPPLSEALRTRVESTPGNGLPPAPVPSACILPDAFCAATSFDSFLTSLLFWINLQLPWTFLLLATQVWQVCRQMTTYEVSNLGRHGWMGGRGTSLQGQMGAMHSATAHAVGAGHAHAHHSGRMGFLMKLMGLDRFTQKKDREGLKKLGSGARNPFDVGCIGNCRDFWTIGREIGVDYERLYEVPLEGFEEAKRRRQQHLEEERFDDMGSGGRKGFMRRMSIGGWASMLGSGRGARDGYAPVRMDDAV